MPTLLFLFCFILAPAAGTWAIVWFVRSRYPGSSRAQVLRIGVPAAAILPLLPVTAMVAFSGDVHNPLLIAIMGTAIGVLAVGLCICLPVGLALTQDMRR